MNKCEYCFEEKNIFINRNNLIFKINNETIIINTFNKDKYMCLDCLNFELKESEVE